MPWLTGWNKRKLKTINGSTVGPLTDFQMKLTVYKEPGIDTADTIYYNNNVKDDFSDIRFTKSDGITLLDYWLESYIYGYNAVVWIKLDSIPESPGSTDIYAYYNNPNALDTSNYVNTFPNIFTENWDTIDNTIWEDKSCGVVNNLSETIDNGKLKIEFSAEDWHPNTGDRSKKTINLVGIVPSRIKFTTELDNTANPAGEFKEHAVAVVVSNENRANIHNDLSDICADRFTNSLHFISTLSASNVTHEIFLLRDGMRENLYGESLPHDSPNIVSWEISIYNKDTVIIYKDGMLIYSSDTFNLNMSEAYLYQGMYSSTASLRYVEFDYITVDGRMYISPEPTFGITGIEETVEIPPAEAGFGAAGILLLGGLAAGMLLLFGRKKEKE